MTRKPLLKRIMLMGLTLGALVIAGSSFAHEGNGPGHDKWKNGKGKKKGHYKDNHNHNARYEDGRNGRGSCDGRRDDHRYGKNDRRYERRDDGRYERRDDRRVDQRTDRRTETRRPFPGIFDKRS
ncbi:hypothetical protein MD537_07430 [Flavihumibacter sediminis]|nr:hypothetical protein [Flavihumibacter sediminis]